MTFNDWFHRHLADAEPATPPPFTPGARVIVSVGVLNAPLARRRGAVLSVEHTTDPNNPYGPWVVTVLLDVDQTRMVFHAAELTREPKPLNSPADIAAAFGVPESVLVEPPMPHADDYEPYTPVGEVPPTCSLPLPFRENIPATPIYDQIREEALAVDGFANQVEADLRVLTEGGAR